MPRNIAGTANIQPKGWQLLFEELVSYPEFAEVQTNKDENISSIKVSMDLATSQA